jgi:hypothetical protein
MTTTATEAPTTTITEREAQQVEHANASAQRLTIDSGLAGGRRQGARVRQALRLVPELTKPGTAGGVPGLVDGLLGGPRAYTLGALVEDPIAEVGDSATFAGSSSWRVRTSRTSSADGAMSASAASCSRKRSSRVGRTGVSMVTGWALLRPDDHPSAARKRVIHIRGCSWSSGCGAIADHRWPGAVVPGVSCAHEG